VLLPKKRQYVDWNGKTVLCHIYTVGTWDHHRRCAVFPPLADLSDSDHVHQPL
jgi:hypothetical protein